MSPWLRSRPKPKLRRRWLAYASSRAAAGTSRVLREKQMRQIVGPLPPVDVPAGVCGPCHAERLRPGAAPDERCYIHELAHARSVR